MRIPWLPLVLMLAPELQAADVTVYVQLATPTSPYPSECIATRMFQQVGISVAWRIANTPQTPDSGVALKVALASSAPPETYPDALAVSYPFASTSSPIVVFCDRIQSRAGTDACFERTLLAHVLVHEIAHVLQGTDRHSDSGIMKSHWDASDYRLMARHCLRFEDMDVALIRKSRLLRQNQETFAFRGDSKGVASAGQHVSYAEQGLGFRHGGR
jgi:hypothetical protein